MLKSELKLYQERLFLFLALILSAYIITSSLIHEATTLIEKKTLQALRAPFIGSNYLLD
jgi:hypothetical protein